LVNKIVEQKTTTVIYRIVIIIRKRLYKMPGG